MAQENPVYHRMGDKENQGNTAGAGALLVKSVLILDRLRQQNIITNEAPALLLDLVKVSESGIGIALGNDGKLEATSTGVGANGAGL
jgi:hypothetical protein